MLGRLLTLSSVLLGTALAADEYSFSSLRNSVAQVVPPRGLDNSSTTPAPTPSPTPCEIEINSTTPAPTPSATPCEIEINSTTPAPSPISNSSKTPTLAPPSAGGSDHVQHKIRAGQVAARGTNLGGWLVAEKWMTSEADIWKDVPAEYVEGGEYLAMLHGSNPEQRRERFDNHHATFIQESDIEAIAKAGLNTVRVPVGYWIMGSDPVDTSGKQEWKTYADGGLKYLDQLIKTWALKHNIAVMISIHAAKGSQNGEMHSAPTVLGTTMWSDYPENVNNTIALAQFLADRYKDDAAFLGLGLINEPNGKTDERILNQYYLDAYKAVRSTGTDCIFSIMPLLYKQTADNLNGFMEAPAYTNVWVEWHPYFIWGYESVSADDLVKKSILTDFQNKVNQWISRPNANRLFFGEWSLASKGQYTNPDTDAFRKWTEAQSKVMKMATAGWTYWSWRVYGDDYAGAFNGWSLRSVLAKPTLAKLVVN